MELESSERTEGMAAVVPRIAMGVKKADDKLVAFVVERPVTALCVALAVGYAVGRIISTRG